MSKQEVPKKYVVVKKHDKVFPRQNVIQFMNPSPLADKASEDSKEAT